jgi:hypothetical protein
VNEGFSMMSARRAAQDDIMGQSANIAGRALLRHPLALPIMAAGVAGTIAASAIILLPDWRLERLSWELYLDRISGYFIPPLGLKARLAIALLAGGMAATLTGGLAWAISYFRNSALGNRAVSNAGHSSGIIGGKTMGLSFPNWKFWDRSAKADPAAEDAIATHVRRRDFHPDAPMPRPVNAHEELGAPLPPVVPAAAEGSPLMQKGAARVAAVMPEAGPVDWSKPDDVLDLGTAISLAEDDLAGPMPAAPTASAAAVAPSSGASGIEYPKWAYEEGQRMAQEDPDYAANAVELARRVHAPTPPEEMPGLPPEIEAQYMRQPIPGSGPDIGPEIETDMAALRNEVAPLDLEAPMAPDAVWNEADFANAEPVQAEDLITSMYMHSMASAGQREETLGAMIDRLERALMQRTAAQGMAVPSAPQSAAVESAAVESAAIELPAEDDPALDAALSTLARMNRQAYG